MPRRQSLPPGERIFGRIEGFHMACPSCGRIFRTRGRRRGKYGPAWSARFDELTGRVCCPHCNRWWAVGLLIYPVADKGGSRGVERRPDDWKPTWSQMRELRQVYGAKYVYGQASGPVDHRNVFVETECRCTLDGSARCPLHKDEQP